MSDLDKLTDALVQILPNDPITAEKLLQLIVLINNALRQLNTKVEMIERTVE